MLQIPCSRTGCKPLILASLMEDISSFGLDLIHTGDGFAVLVIGVS